MSAEDKRRLLLIDEEHDAYVAFVAAAREMREHATRGQALQQKYRDALERLSAVVAP